MGVLAVLALAGCGGSNGFRGEGAGAPMATGPISRACLSSDRKARSGARCGCIQAVANQTLNGAEQRRAVGFYKNPHEAQEIRQSDRPVDERFWRTYMEYADRAERICR